MLLSSPLRSLQVTITNFSLSKLLVSDDELLRDQRGSLAYISPDVLSGESTRSMLHICVSLYVVRTLVL